MSKNNTRLKMVLRGSGEAVLPLLKGVYSAADVFPPLKSAVGGAILIGETVVVSLPASHLAEFVLHRHLLLDDL